MPIIPSINTTRCAAYVERLTREASNDAKSRFRTARAEEWDAAASRPSFWQAAGPLLRDLVTTWHLPPPELTTVLRQAREVAERRVAMFATALELAKADTLAEMASPLAGAECKPDHAADSGARSAVSAIGSISPTLPESARAFRIEEYLTTARERARMDAPTSAPALSEVPSAKATDSR
jgi:hypothetical protein